MAHEGISMKNKQLITVMLILLAVSACAGGDFFATAEPEQTKKIPAEYYLTNRQICAHALDLTSSPPAWDPLSSSLEFVAEANRRGIMPRQCAQLLGLPAN